MDFAVPANQSTNKKSKNLDKFMDIYRDLRNWEA